MSQEQFDKKLDHLARKAAEQGHIPFSDEAWNKMEHLLDKDDKRRRFFAWWWSLPLLLLVAGVGYWAFSSNTKPADGAGNVAAAKEKTIPNTTTPLQVGEQTNAGDKDQQNKTQPTTTTVADDNTTKNLTSVTVNNIDNSTSKNIGITAVQQDKSSLKNKPTIAGPTAIKKRNTVKSTGKKTNTTIGNGMIDDVDDDDDKTATANDKADISTVKGSANIDTKQASPTGDVTTVKTDSSIIAKKDAPVKKLVADSLKNDTIAKAITPAKNKTNKHGFEFSLLVGGDATTAAFKRVDYISGSVGVGIAYSLTNKISLATGLIVSNKLYKADTTTYKNVQRPSTHYYVTNIDARCLVLDVPLNIQYKISEHKNSGWYAIAGLSTYFMKEEKYDYDYVYYNQPKKLSYTINDENKHWFSVLNLSAAYRRSSAKNRLAWQLAPYAKIPLTGIGEGKVKLYSVGLSFSMLLTSKK